MADDITLPGASAIVATDDIGAGRQVQLVKPVFGADGTATMVSGADPMPVGDIPLVITATATSAITAIDSMDVSQYSTVKIVTSGTWNATFTVEVSHDNATWTNAQSLRSSSNVQLLGSVNVGTTAISNVGSFNYCVIVSVAARYLRVRLTSYTSGTFVATLTAVRGTAPLQPVYLASAAAIDTTDSFGGTVGLVTAGYGMGYNGNAWVRHRLPAVFKSASTAASGDTAVWTPTAGRRFQLLRFQVFASANAAQSAGGTITATLRDNTTSTGIAVPIYVPGTGGTALGGWTSGWIDIGPYGYRSAAVNNVLNVNLSAALTAGSIGVIACGTEET